ncbi:MAG: hypothetical protein KGK10_13850 [Rhodospirillales bacterium]|nr:hypothetical protein [Rhodospirillales bacterium]
MPEAPPLPQDEAAESVAAYLRAHPGFLAARPALYAALTPPLRRHGEGVADHLAAMVAAARHDAASVVAAGRASAALAARVQEAVLALFNAASVPACVSEVFPPLLGVDAASLCVEQQLAGTRCLAPGEVERRLGGRSVAIGAACGDPTVHGEAAPLAFHDALVLVPGLAAPAMLALATRHADLLAASHVAGVLGFLGRAVAAAWLA